MDEPRDYHIKREKDKYNITSIWNLKKNDINEFIYKIDPQT